MVAHLPRACIIVGSTNVDEYAPLLNRIDALFQEAGKNFSFQACWSLRNLSEYRTAKDIDTCINDPQRLFARLFRKSNDSAASLHLYRPVAACIQNRHYCHRGHAAMSPME